jgi:hypothetical protein
VSWHSLHDSMGHEITEWSSLIDRITPSKAITIPQE